MAYKSDVSNASNFDSLFEPPTSGDPGHNATLTITMRYQLVFADRTRLDPALRQREGHFYAVDSDGIFFPIIDWDAKSRREFSNAFQRGESIWNAKFKLLTPASYTELDFIHPASGMIVRPNILCLFRMEPSADYHQSITVCRLERNGRQADFRSNSGLLDDLDAWTRTLGHELGHMTGMNHIKALLGDERCMIHPNENRCYGETEHEKANIMGGGTELWPLNAKPWLDRIAEHTNTKKYAWKATMDMKTLPQILSFRSGVSA